MRLRALTLLGSLLASGCAGAAATGAQETPLIDSLEVAENLYWFRPDTPIGNQSSLIYISDTASVIIDTNIDTVAPRLLDFLADRVDETDRIYAIVSHHHGDHAQGLETMSGRVIAIVPDTQYERLATTALTFPGSPPLAAGALPDIRFADRLTLDIDGQNVEIMRPPNRAGHTDGDAIVLMPAKGVLYVGDYYFADRLPIIDFDGGGDIDGYLDNLDWIVRNTAPDTIVIPGHGLFSPEPQRVDTVRTFAVWAENIRRAVDEIDAHIAAGMSEDEAAAAGLPKDLKWMGDRPRYMSEERWIRALYAQRMAE